MERSLHFFIVTLNMEVRILFLDTISLLKCTGFFFFCYCCSVSFFPQNKIPEKLKRRGELSYKIWVKPVENMITWALPDELQPFSTKMASSFTYEKDLSWTFRNYDKMNGLLGLMSPSHLTRSKSKARYNRNTTNIKKKKKSLF